MQIYSKHNQFKGGSKRERIQISIVCALLLFMLFAPLNAQEQSLDEEYTAKIKEFTTETFFMTKYVDHLPYAEGIPTPLDILGHIAGAPDIVSYSHEVYKFMQALADASPRVTLTKMGKTEEGRDMILVVVADEETIANLDEYKKINALLADPRKITEPSEAEELIAKAKPMYWATGALHSGETGSPEMLMELAYRIAVGESEFIKTIRNNMIVMITPILEVDGRDKVVDLFMAKRKDPEAAVPSNPIYWGKYVSHDNNRDNVGMGLNLTNHVIDTYMEFHPQVMHDLHESIAYLYTSTGTGPYNAWVDPILVDEWQELAHQEVSEMTRLGVPGVWTHGFYDGWAPNYLFYVANGHNSIGRFYETQTARDGSTQIVRSSENRSWFKPNPPLSEAVWSFRNNINYQQSGILIAMNHTAKNASKFMGNFYLKSLRSIQKAKTEGPAAYVIPGDNSRPAQAASLIRLLQRHGIEVHKTNEKFETKEGKFVEGSFVVRLDQPYSRMADLLMDKQYYNVNDPRPYDDVGWTVGPLYNVDTVRIEDVAVLSEPMDIIQGKMKLPGGVEKLKGGKVQAYIINHDASNSLASFRFIKSELKIEAAEEEFEVEERKFNAGSFLLKTEDNSDDLKEQLEEAGNEFEFTAYSVSEIPEFPTHVLDVPRIAIMHTWQNTQTEGWLRMGFDKLNIPYEYISVLDVRDEPNLREKYDVIVFGPSSGNAFSIVNGLPLTGDPMPWKKSELTPNIGVQDETDDMRGGLEMDGIFNLYNFLKQGGLFITLTSSSSIPIQFGMAQGLQIKQTPNLWARGGVYSTTFRDRKSPIAYGYGEDLGANFNSSPVFSFSTGGGRPRGTTPTVRTPGSTTTRPSGRGGIGERDVVQGRMRDMAKESVAEFRKAQKKEAEAKAETSGASTRQTISRRPRIVLAFQSDVKKLLISGGIDGGNELIGSPAVVDAKVGEGHVVMFSINPFWRNQTHGAYFLVFNAMMNYKNLDAGK
ncbi:M14 family zinc carboxypeptidase [Acidobacteriota bacterium]